MLSQRVLERYPGLKPPPFITPYIGASTCICSEVMRGGMRQHGISFIRPAKSRPAPKPVEKAPSVLGDDPELSYVMDRIDSLVADMPTEEKSAWKEGWDAIGGPWPYLLLGIALIALPFVLIAMGL